MLQASVHRARNSVAEHIHGESIAENPRGNRFEYHSCSLYRILLFEKYSCHLPEQHHPGTRVYVSSRFCGWNSLLSMMHQAKAIGNDLLQVSALHPEGFHMIGNAIL